MSRRTLHDLLREARATIDRLTPAEAWTAAEAGALILDTRVSRGLGVVPGSMHVPLSVLEWRVDPASEWRNPHVGGFDTHLILICDHGESSSLAAASLRELGFTRVADVIGGFEGWQAAGLPVTTAPPQTPGLPGMAGPLR